MVPKMPVLCQLYGMEPPKGDTFLKLKCLGKVGRGRWARHRRSQPRGAALCCQIFARGQCGHYVNCPHL